MGGFAMKSWINVVALLLCGSILVGCEGERTSAQLETTVITVYSARKEHLIKPLFDRYTEKTGMEIRYVTDSAGALLARLEAEGETQSGRCIVDR